MSVIIAVDKCVEADVLRLVDSLDPALCRIKIGKEVFTHFGSSIVHAVQQRGFEVFLDLKFHDIPNTTSQAVLAAADMGVWMVNVHASGGRQMMQTTAQKLAASGYNTLLTGVTVLTSMSSEELAEVGVNDPADVQVMRLARLAQSCGLHGVVCSAQETEMLRQALGQDFILVTPGIRPTGSDVGDQKRIATPAAAMRMGSTHLVIGRPITQAANPLLALQQIMAEIV